MIRISGYEIIKYKLFSLTAPLYTKLRKKKILDNETRLKIQDHIKSKPGDHFNSIKRSLGLPHGALAYHLSTLEREGFIKSRRQGMYKQFFSADIKLTDNNLHLNNSRGKIFGLINKSPGLSQKEIAEKIDLSMSTVNYHINSLADLGSIRLERWGKKIKCYPGKEVS